MAKWKVMILMGLLYSKQTLALPDAFTYLNDDRIIQSMNYATNENFVGRPIAGYEDKVCILTKEARNALIKVQDELDSFKKGYKLKVFDCYRPTLAVADFVRWSQDPKDLKMKHMYYPDLEKPELFKQGYIADKSGHSRGSTVDLTIAVMGPQDPANPEGPRQYTELDMGTTFDFFGEESHTDSKAVSAIAQENRQFLKKVMEKHGFKNYEKEWWHYTLVEEPFPNTYFEFVVN